MTLTTFQVATRLDTALGGAFKNNPVTRLVALPRRIACGRLWAGIPHIAVAVPPAVLRTTRNYRAEIATYRRSASTGITTIIVSTTIVASSTSFLTRN